MDHVHIIFLLTLSLSLPFSILVGPLRESLCSVLLALEKHLGEIASAGDSLIVLQEKITKLDREANILKDAVSTPSHPLITMQDRSVEGWEWRGNSLSID